MLTIPAKPDGSEKRSKKLSVSGARAFSKARAQINKVFFASFLFTKKKNLLITFDILVAANQNP
ncbi:MULTISPECIES: hypothetical protein [Acidiphilium]|uniref:hypothetical protein n=1 Tax=Acidiphilium TaxID=522 RepID=UPI001115997E|nr:MULTISPECIES: hypothetical protein [Acidiphilium]